MAKSKILLLLCAAPLALLGGSARAAEEELERLSDPAAYRRVCDAVRTELSVRFDGDEVQRGKARADFKRRRDEAMGQVYVGEIAASGFAFGEYEFEQRRLPLDMGRPLRVADGVELIFKVSSGQGVEEDYDFSLPPEVAQRVVRDRSAGTLKLRTTFRLATSQPLPDPCVRLGGGRALRMRIEPLSFELLSADGKSTYGRVESTRYRDAVSDFVAVAKPRVSISKTSDLEDPATIRALESHLLGCYKSGLEKNARLRGSIVVGINVDKEGQVESVRPEIDAIGDKGVIDCTMQKVRAQRFPRGKSHLSVPVYFQGSE